MTSDNVRRSYLVQSDLETITFSVAFHDLLTFIIVGETFVSHSTNIFAGFCKEEFHIEGYLMRCSRILTG